MPTDEPANLAQSMDRLKPKGKSPASARVLHTWIAQARDSLGSAGSRLDWLVAATVVTAVLQRVVDDSGTALFLLKGGTMLQYRLPGMSRSTQDVDGLVRGSIDDFLAALDTTLVEPWGPLTFVRGEVETIDVPHKLAKPRRFDMTVLLKGVTWRRIHIEVSPDEGHAGAAPEWIPSPSLSGFGIPTPDHLVSLSICYQIAQKIHAATDPHNPPGSVNDRARDVVDLLLLRTLTEASANPSLIEIRAAVEDIFATRATEAQASSVPARTWPSRVASHQHWKPSFAKAADSVGLALTLVDAVAQVNDWLDRIEDA